MYLWQRGDYRQARVLVERALAIREAHLGSDHPHTARSLNCLGCILDQQGDPQNAAALHKRALAIREARLDANDFNTGFDVGESLHNLAWNLRDRGTSSVPASWASGLYHLPKLAWGQTTRSLLWSSLAWPTSSMRRAT